MRTRISLISAVFAAFFAASTAALATVTVSSPNFSFAGNWPANQPVAAGSSVPVLPPDIAAATAGGVPFANGAYGTPHTIAHLVDGLYGNSYSWLTTSQSLSRWVTLGGSYTNVNMAFAGVAFSNAALCTVSDIVFGRTAAGPTEYNDRFVGTMYIQITTTNSLAAITNLAAAADAQWTTMGSFTTTDPYEHQFIFSPAVQATGVRIVVNPQNCIDEIVVHSTLTGYQVWDSGSVLSTNFTYSGDWPAYQPVAAGMAVPSTPPNLAAASAGGIPFANSVWDQTQAPGAHSIAHLNDGLYGNAYSWISAVTNAATFRSVALGGFYGSPTNSFAGVAFSNATPYALSDITFGRSAAGEYVDRLIGPMYIQITTANSVAAITNLDASADAQWTTLGYITTTIAYEHVFTLSHPVKATGVRIVTAIGNCIDEIVVHGVPAPTPVWDAVTTDSAATDGAGVWDNMNTNWWNGTANTAWTAGGLALIGAGNGAAGIIDVGDSVSLSGIQFHAPGSGSYMIRSNALSLVGTAVINCQTNLTISSLLTGNGFEKFGAGALTLCDTNSYTGATVLSRGVLNVGVITNGGIASTIGASSTGATNLVFADGTLRYTGPTVSTDRKFTIRANQSAVLDVTGAGTTLTFAKINGSSFASTAGITKNGPGTLVLGNDGIPGGSAYVGEIGAYVINQGSLLTVENDPAQLNLNNLTPSAALTLGDGVFFGNGYTALNNSSIGADQLVRYTGTNQTATLTGLCFTGPTNNWNTKVFDVNNGAADVDLLMTSNIVIYPVGAISRLRKTGAGTLKLTGPSLFTGTTIIRDGRIIVTNSVLSGSAGPLGQSTADMFMGEPGSSSAGTMQTFVFDGSGPFTFSRGISVVTNDASAVVLGCLSDASVTFSGAIALSNAVQFLSVASGTNAVFVTGAISGPGGVTAAGTGTVVLAAANTYTGLTTVAAGTLRLGASDRIADTSPLRFTGGTFDTAGYSETLGSLDVDGAAVIDFGNGSSVLRFAASSGQTWSGTLTVRNWSGSSFGNGADRLYVGTSTNGLTAAQLAKITVRAGRKTLQLSTGEVVPAPQGTLALVW